MKLFLLLLLATSSVFAKEPPISKVLIFGKTQRSAHEKIIPIAGKALTNLLKSEGYQPTFSDDSAIFTSPKIESFSTIIFLDVSQGSLETEQKLAFEKYVEQGGGLVAIHASISAAKDWPWFRDLIGTLFLDHPKVQNAAIHADKSGTPAMTTLKDSWVQSDEWYNYTNPLPPSFHILATIDETTYEGGKMGKNHPISWCKEVGKARVFYTAMGHAASLYQDLKSDFSRQIVWAVKWTERSKNRGQISEKPSTAP